MMHSVLHCSEHWQSAHLRHLIRRGHGSLNIAVLLLLHQALLGPSTNRMEVKLAVCLGFKAPLFILQYGQETLAPIISCYSGFMPLFIILLNHTGQKWSVYRNIQQFTWLWICYLSITLTGRWDFHRCLYDIVWI